MTLKEIGKIFGCSQHTVRRRMIEFGIPIRKTSESIKIRGSMKGVNNPVYGKHIWSSKPHPRGMLGKTPWNKGKRFSVKSRKTMSLVKKALFQSGKLKPWNRGISCSDETRQKISQANKGRSPWWKKKGFKQNPCIKLYKTKPEIKFKEICDLHQLPFRYTGDGSFWVGNMNPDFIHLTENIAIEIFGDYWHSPELNPNIPYVRTYKGRKEAFEREGWKLIIFWESELMSNKATKIVLGRLKHEHVL